MKKKNEISRKSSFKAINNLSADFCWIFLPNGDCVSIHNEMDYSQYLHEHYESKSNIGM